MSAATTILAPRGNPLAIRFVLVRGLKPVHMRQTGVGTTRFRTDHKGRDPGRKAWHDAGRA